MSISHSTYSLTKDYQAVLRVGHLLPVPSFLLLVCRDLYKSAWMGEVRKL